MSIVGVFTQSRPEISGIYFDAVLEESTELQTDVSEFPIEDGSLGNDHATRRPLRISMIVGMSDNAFRALRRQAGSLGALAGIGAGAGVGAVAGQLNRYVAAGAGLAASIANAAFAAGQSSSSSGTALEEIRELQRANALLTVVSSKGRTYENVMITNTRQVTNKENEQGLELVVEMQEMLIINSTVAKRTVPAPNDTASTQAPAEVDLGEVSAA